MKEGLPPLNLAGHPTLRAVYVDNIAGVSNGPPRVQSHHELILEGFDGRGLKLHDIFGVGNSTDLLGYRLGGIPPRVDNHPKRMWRFLDSVRHILGKRRISGALLEVVLGHFVSLSLLNRFLLSVPQLCYRFVADQGSKWCRIPRGVRREMEMMVALLPLGGVALDSPCHMGVSCSDASGADGGYGFAVCVTEFESDEAVHEISKPNERWRFREKSCDEQHAAFLAEDEKPHETFFSSTSSSAENGSGRVAQPRDFQTDPDSWLDDLLKKGNRQKK